MGLVLLSRHGVFVSDSMGVSFGSECELRRCGVMLTTLMIKPDLGVVLWLTVYRCLLLLEALWNRGSLLAVQLDFRSMRWLWRPGP